MNLIKESELITINGGSVKKAVLFGVLALSTLVAGIIDGLLRPLKCNK